MKKLLFIVAVIAASSFASCKKESINPTNMNAGIQNTPSYNLKFSEEIIIYDETNTHSIKLKLQSDNEQYLKETLNNYKGVKLILLWNKESPLNENNITTETEIISESDSSLLELNSNKLYLSITNVNIGNAIGYKISFPEITYNKNRVMFAGHGNMILNITCSVAQIICLSGSFSNVTSNYWTGSNWLFENSTGPIRTNGAGYVGTYNGLHQIFVQSRNTFTVGDLSVFIE
jgi:hypothetical protein